MNNPPNHTETSRVLILIPTYCERETLPSALSRTRKAIPEADILVIDDNSPDGTGKYADEVSEQDAKVHVLHRDGKGGLGVAYIAGFDWGLEHGYDILIEMDADGSHQPEDLPRLVQAVREGADLAIGSRWVPGGKVVNWPLNRKIISRTANVYTEIALGAGVKDITAGFRAYRAEILGKIDYRNVSSHGYCFQIDLAWRTISVGGTVVEIPITFVERQLGSSKMSGGIVFEALFRVTQWGLQHRAEQVGSLLGNIIRR